MLVLDIAPRCCFDCFSGIRRSQCFYCIICQERPLKTSSFLAVIRLKQRERVTRKEAVMYLAANVIVESKLFPFIDELIYKLSSLNLCVGKIVLTYL